MKIDDPVRVYDKGGWFSEGTITAVDFDGVRVDFADWVQVYTEAELSLEYILYEFVLVAIGPGKTVETY